jgi:energy-coupling factor transporter transmembrane protein EcfT
MTWPHVLLPAALAIFALTVLDRRQLRALFNKWFLLGLAVAVLLPVWLIGTPGRGMPNHPGGGQDAFAAGLTMAARIVTTYAALLIVGGAFAPATIARTLERLLGRNVATACAIGVNLLPAVLEILRRTHLSLKLRGGFKRNRLANAKRLATAVGVQTVRLTEDVAEALLLANAASMQSDGGGEGTKEGRR